MSAQAEGCYIHLLCRSWKSKTPGVIPARRVAEMSGLHRVPEQNRERVLSEMSAAFTVTETEWSQRRMKIEWKRAWRIYRARKASADNTNAARGIARSPLRSPIRSSRRSPLRRPPVGVGVGVGVGISETGVEVRSTSPDDKKSEPAAMQPFKSTSRPKPDPTAREPATCHHCRHHFARPAGSTRQTCPDCHRKGIR